ncbi:MAG: glycosyltransferase family 4 protein [Mucilaginibacter sp.]|nr:glycosyltransferase family 4 protein [Mucilaginibacter sp.]
MVIVSHPTANQNVRAALKGFVEEDMLYEFHTSIASFPGTMLDKLGRINAFSEIRRRHFDPELKPFTRVWPLMEVGRIIANKIGLTKLTAREKGFFCIDAVFNKLDKKVASRLEKAAENGVKAVYAYEDGALESFTQAKKLGLTCIYDLPIAYWETGRRLMLQEADRVPGWAETLGGGISDSAEKLDRKTRELEMADIIIVASKFVKDSLPEWASKKKVIISPFGTPALKNKKEFTGKETNKINKPLRVLFAGSMGQRKGLGDLFAAMKLLNRKDAELVVMGSLQAPMNFYRNEYADFTYEPGRPNEDVLALMRTCDVFCLPSIVEGRALVMQEAMSQGLPLIITPNTGGEDLVIEGKTGFLVPIRSPEVIAEKITWFLENRSKIPEMQEAAKVLAQTYTWVNYRKQIVESIKALTN